MFPTASDASYSKATSNREALFAPRTPLSEKREAIFALSRLTGG